MFSRIPVSSIPVKQIAGITLPKTVANDALAVKASQAVRPSLDTLGRAWFSSNSRRGPQPRSFYRTLRPYVPGESLESVSKQTGIPVDKIVKVASNECWKTAAPPEKVAAALATKNYYPDLDSSGLAEKIAAYVNNLDSVSVSADQIVITPGSADAIIQVNKTFVEPGDEVLTAQDSFVMYDLATVYSGGTLKKVPLKDGVFDLDGLADAVTDKTKVIFIANPNNPTGTIVHGDKLKAFLSRIPEHLLVVLDEAYHEFVKSSAYTPGTQLMQDFPHNLMVLRTMSKSFGLAGYRVGYGIGPKALIAEVLKGIPPFGLTNASIAAADIALDNPTFPKEILEVLTEEKAYLYNELDKLDLRYFPTESNFICVFVPENGQAFAQKLKKLGVIVRPQPGDVLSKAIRITISLPEHNQRTIKALTQVLSDYKSG